MGKLNLNLIYFIVHQYCSTTLIAIDCQCPLIWSHINKCGGLCRFCEQLKRVLVSVGMNMCNLMDLFAIFFFSLHTIKGNHAYPAWSMVGSATPIQILRSGANVEQILPCVFIHVFSIYIFFLAPFK